MTDWSPSRRTVLRTGGAVGAAAFAGCLPGGGDGGTDGTAADSPIETVPAGSQLVVHADVATLLNDERLRSRLNDLLGAVGDQAPMGASDVESALDAVEDAADLDPRALRTVTVFGGYEADAAAGLRLEADWAEATLRDAVAGGMEPETTTYNDRTVYRYGEETALGVLEDGTYVTGTTAGVEGTIDVAAGDADPAAGRIREAFTAAPSGPLRFAFLAPDDLGEGAGGSGPVDPSAFASVTHGYGGYVAGESGTGSITLETESGDAAASVAEELRSARDAALEQLESAETQRELAGELEALLSSLSVSADGSAVTVTVAEGDVFPVALLAVAASFLLGLGSQTEPAGPQATFAFEYDSAGELTVTHQGGDYVPASQLVIQGQGLGDTGTWSDLGGSASGDIDGQPAVAAGDSVTVSAEPDYVVRVVWRSEDGSTSSTLSMDQGPEA